MPTTPKKKISKGLLAAIKKQTRGSRRPTKVEKDKTKYDRKRKHALPTET